MKLFFMANLYRSTLTRTRFNPTCSSSKLIHNTENGQSSIQSHNLIKKMHSGNEDDGTANSKVDNSSLLYKLKTNVNWMLGNIKVPSLAVPDVRKILQTENITDSMKKGTGKIIDSVVLKQQHFKKKQMAKRKESEEKLAKVNKSKVDNFSSQMQDMNDSIVSYYDTTSIEELTATQQAIEDEDIQKIKDITAKADTKLDEAGIWRLFGSAFSQTASAAVQQETTPVVRKDFVSRASIESRTKALVHNLKQASSLMSKLKRTEDLCSHLIQYPDSRMTAVKEKCLPILLRLYKTKDISLKAQVSQALSLVGYMQPPKGRGVRILTIDGGGTRGLMAIQALKKLQETCKTDITNLFDYVCGVSTGSLLAGMVFLCHIPLEEVEDRYIEFSSQMFTRSRLLGTGKLVWNHAFYDTEIWEKILKMNVNESSVMADFAKDTSCPKYSAISCLINVPKMKNFMFRTYNLPPGVFSQYPGNCKHKVWEAIRASSAAPGYYEEFALGDYVHQDGGLLTNNPTAIAVHECKLMWPDESIQCVVSLGNGRFEPNLEITPLKSSLKDKVAKVIDSATDTEAVHTILQDLLPSSTYYRFNPYMSEEFRLDEIRQDKIKQMQQDADMYLRKNDFKLKSCVDQLLLKRHPHQTFLDNIKAKADSSMFAENYW